VNNRLSLAPPRWWRSCTLPLLFLWPGLSVAQADAPRPGVAPPVAVGPAVTTQKDQQAENIAALRTQLPAQLATAKVTEEQRQKVLGLLVVLDEIVNRRVATAQEKETVSREFLARGGELRDLIEDLGLPDPHDLLPPGPHSRLGISFGENPTGHAVVAMVLPQYRADKMGMQVGDQILTLNGAPISAKHLIETVVKAQRPYVIEVLRHGTKVVLTEPKP
jgi:hypothetical protein